MVIENEEIEGGGGGGGWPNNPNNVDINNGTDRAASLNVNVSQAQLRQQAHAPILGLGNAAAGVVGGGGGAAAAGGGGRGGTNRAPSAVAGGPARRMILPGLQNLSVPEQQQHQVQQQQQQQRSLLSSIHVPECGEWDSPTSANNTSGWSIVETNGGTPPSARSLHAAAVLNGVLYVWGGYNGDRLNTFHAFSFAEKRWSPVLPSTSVSSGPSPRDRHVAFAYGNSFYIHGGFDGTSRVSDFWGFDFSSMQWREVEVLGGRPPSPRHSHAAVVYRHSLFVFGGYDGSYK